MKIKTIDRSLRPREKALHYGMTTLTDAELLALLIRNGTKEKSCIDLAVELLNHYGSLHGVVSASLDTLVQTKGISTVKAIELMAVMELAKRISNTTISNKILIDDPQPIIDYMRIHYGQAIHEELVCFYLDGASQLMEVKAMGHGSTNELVVDIKAILHHGITIEASNLIIAHNHPSGCYQPSEADIRFTHLLDQACRLVDIDLLDHIIVTMEGSFIFSKVDPSFNDDG